ncbi:cytochrome P450 93A3-like [Diospyros lotus]|uniref:cytochrome P450 93A3-like n=1 Tax=Diospyros lotus TaxID=55363 RepID=UPI002256836D|nr:cytochrome P450 93A3-like [Diospyros lotus]
MADLPSSVVFLLIWLASMAFLRARARARTLPPSPLALPVVGHLHLLSPIPHQAFHKLSIRYGPLIHLFLGSVPCLVASSPETAKEFLKTHETAFSNRPQMAAVDYLTYGSKDFSFAPYGAYWKFMKKLCMSELLGGRTLDLLLPIRRDEMERFVGLLLEKAVAGEAVDVRGELMRVTSNIVSRMIMSERCSENEGDAGEVRKLIQDTAELTGKFNLSDFIWFCKNLDLQGFRRRLREVRDRFDEMMDRIIGEHEEARKKKKKMMMMINESCDHGGEAAKDLLDILLDISEDESSEMRLSKENIKAFVLDLFAAGTDTAALTTEWALAELINHPEIMDRARKEVDEVVGRSRVVEESDIAKLPYLQAIVKETLRLHPTGPLIVRESSEDCTIMGYKIPARTRLFVNVWAIGRDPNHWENPLEFRPERFLLGEEGSGKGQLLDVRGQHFHLLPFGSGRRGCPGTTLAMQVVQASLAAMVQCFEWRVGDGGNGSVDMEEGLGLTLPRAHPLVCVPVARLHPFPSM